MAHTPTCCDTTHTLAVDDYERIVGPATRSIGDNLDLLHTALTALRNGDTHVTDEYLDRAMLSLKRTHETLLNRSI